MGRVIPQRMAAEIEGDFVVFLIGMRVNKPWKPHKWLPVFLAMPRMLKELSARPESGFLGFNELLRPDHSVLALVRAPGGVRAQPRSGPLAGVGGVQSRVGKSRGRLTQGRTQLGAAGEGAVLEGRRLRRRGLGRGEGDDEGHQRLL